MSVSSLALFPGWRDYWGMWNALVEPWAAPLEQSKCHGPRLAVLPELDAATFDQTGKTLYNFHLVPGSLIWGMWVPSDPTVTIQLTDLNLGYEFFQQPMTADQLATTSFNNGYFPSFTLLPTPHPVVGDGLFSYEAWGAPGASFVMALGVAEVTECPVR